MKKTMAMLLSAAMVMSMGLMASAATQDYSVLVDGDKLTLTNGTEVGRVTSGTFAPSLGKAIAFAWVQADKANENDFLIQTGRASLKAHRTEIPFYKDGTARRKLQ